MTQDPQKNKPARAIHPIVLALIVATVLAVFGFTVFILSYDIKTRPLEAPLAQLVPTDFGVWTGEDTPTEMSTEMQARVDYILKYDDALTRTYKSSTGLTLSLYVAYWNAGKVPVHEAGLHNPDTCWVVSGWKRGERKNNCEQSIDGQALKTFEYGAYIKDKHTEYVIFWHLVGDSVNRIDIVGHRNGLEGKIERFILALKSMKKLGFNQRREQLFIRLSSPVPYEELWNRPDFHEFLEHMAPLRIFAANIPADNTPVSE